MESNKDLLKWLRMTERKWTSVIVILISAPVSLMGVILFISLNWISPYNAWILLVTVVIGIVPFLLTLGSVLNPKELPLKFYPIFSMSILLGITVSHLMIMSSARTNAISRARNRQTPVIQTGEFPFRVVYELDGERFVVEDTITCRFNGWSSREFNFRRSWQTRLTSEPERIVGFRSLPILEDEEMQGEQRRIKY